MNGSRSLAAELASAAAGTASALSSATVILCPPAILLPEVAASLKGSRARCSGQDCHAEASGAFTGDISAVMLKECGADYVILGHSERRQFHGESDENVRQKAHTALQHGLTPIICIGESQEQRAAGQAEAVVGAQVRGSLPESAKNHDFLLAYEPVWAIGSGAVPTTAEIAQMHAHIAHVAAAHLGCSPTSIAVIYGGSVKAQNARDILHTTGVSGVLVGGASLKAEEFSQIALASRNG